MGFFLTANGVNMGFKSYIEVAPIEKAKALIREGAELIGSIRKLAMLLPFSPTHIYRWSNAESNMSAKDYQTIRAIITKEKKRREETV